MPDYGELAKRILHHAKVDPDQWSVDDGETISRGMLQLRVIRAQRGGPEVPATHVALNLLDDKLDEIRLTEILALPHLAREELLEGVLGEMASWAQVQPDMMIATLDRAYVGTVKTITWSPSIDNLRDVVIDHEGRTFALSRRGDERVRVLDAGNGEQ